MITSALLLILALNLTSGIFLVSGDAGGTGKYLGIEFLPEDVRSSDCIVTATKVNSGQVFQFKATDVTAEGIAISENKVGAGTVLLEAEPGDGWIFSEFQGDVIPIDGTKSVLYKPVKYGEVIAVFEEAYTITVNVISAAEADYVETTIGSTHQINKDNSPYTITGVAAGDTPVFDFVPGTGNHISVFQVNGEFQTSADKYEFDPIYANQQITVFFSLDGEAYIPLLASNVPISLGGDVSLNFGTITDDGTATQAEIVLVGDLSGTSLLLWEVGVEGVKFTGTTIIALPYTGVEPNSVFTSNDLNALYCDVDADGEVTNADANAVAIALSSNGREYDPMYDVNRDSLLDSADIQLVHDYLGTTLEELYFEFDESAGILYISTEHFSIFRAR